jgi:hypothetical protein
MAFNTAHTGKMGTLVGEPLMFGQQIGIYFVGEQLKFIDVGMATEANSIVVCYSFKNILLCTGTDTVLMRIMALPTGKFIFQQFCVHTALIFLIDLLKLVHGDSFISFMAVEAFVFLFQFTDRRMWIGRKLFAMAVGAFERFMIGLVKQGAVDEKFLVSPFSHRVAGDVVEIVEIALPVAAEAGFVECPVFGIFFVLGNNRGYGHKSHYSQSHRDYKVSLFHFTVYREQFGFRNKEAGSVASLCASWSSLAFEKGRRDLLPVRHSFRKDGRSRSASEPAS